MKSAWGLFLGLCACTGTWAQVVDDVPGEIRHQRERLNQQRARINQMHEQQVQACWQKSALNDCLSAVRKSKRLQLDPIHQQELQLNAQERDWRIRQREERLQNKAAEGVPGER